jgi:sigma-B regulation protein RsbU (phosphoserine phosphatase)
MPDPTPSEAPQFPAPGFASASVSWMALTRSRRAGTPSRVLIAEDDAVSRVVLERTLRKWGHDVITTRDGLEAWDVLQQDDAPPLAVLDWMMPGLEGPELCRRVRALARPVPTYLLLLTARDGTADVVAGLDSGADDFVSKPFDPLELASRLRVGERVVGLQRAMAARVNELEVALGQVKQLRGLLPICAYCKSVRDHKNYWQQVETYITAHSDARFSHGICPDCWDEVVVPELSAGLDPG